MSILECCNLQQLTHNIHEIDDGQSLLHHAVSNSHLELVQELIKQGINVNIKDVYGRTPLHYASNIKIVLILIENGASVNEQDIDGASPLYNAENGEIVSLLVSKGANVNDGVNGTTPLHASMNGSLDTVQALIRHGANINCKNHYGSTPLHRATFFGRVDVVQELLKHDVNVIEQDNSGTTCLHEASRFGYLEIVKLIIPYSNLEFKDNKGQTALDVVKTEEIRQFIQDFLDFPEIKEPG